MTQHPQKIDAGWQFENSYARLPELFYTKAQPKAAPNAKLVILNEPFARALGLHSEALKTAESIAVFAGNHVPDGAEPLAQAYAGHQFGHFTMLGDGRAILLGEHITPSGDRFDIQLKGAGRTRYSRGGDGRAAIGPMLREYIISEAMHALKIPTTRSLAVVTTGEPVLRETELEGAVLTRVASSHLRVGTFEFAHRWGKKQDLQDLADYALVRHYGEVEWDSNRYRNLLRAVIDRQAALISKWQLVGFIHGVMNTDNMAISGETIDYGPCAFMDTYHPNTVFSSIDREGRYAYGNQPYIAAWNLARFAEALLPLLHGNEEEALKIAEDEINRFGDLFRHHWLRGMRNKLGIVDEEEADESLIKQLLDLMQQYKADYTNTFVALTFGKLDELDLFGTTAFQDWHKEWRARLSRQEATDRAARDLMQSHNPAIIPRNHRVEEALAAAGCGDLTLLWRLLEALSNPYAHDPRQAEYAALPEQSNKPYRTFCGT